MKANLKDDLGGTALVPFGKFAVEIFGSGKNVPVNQCWEEAVRSGRDGKMGV